MNCILTTFIKILNNPEIKDINYQIALCIMKNLYCFEEMTIQQLAKQSYVSVSSINRFIKNYGFKSFTFFKKSVVIQYKERLNDIELRESKKKNEACQTMCLSILKNQYNIEMIDDLVNSICDKISKSRRIILIGSDELMSHLLRFQVDFTMMKKVSLQKSIYKDHIEDFEEDDFIILFSMTGRIIDLNNYLMDLIQKNNNDILTIGIHTNIPKSLSFEIPREIDESIQIFFMEYFIEKILYTYFEKYYAY